VFLIAGFDTTYTAMNNCFHTLTAHPDEMKKLQDEIDSVLNDVKSNKIF
jgi:cytochrome P450